MEFKQLEILLQKIKPRLRLYLSLINSKWIIDLNLECKIVRLLEHNTGEKLIDNLD